MPSEQEIVKTLIDAGFKIVYVPKVVIELPEGVTEYENAYKIYAQYCRMRKGSTIKGNDI